MSDIIPLRAMLRDLREVKPMPTPQDNPTLRELINGALTINNIALERMPTPQELLLQQQWLKEIQRLVMNRR